MRSELQLAHQVGEYLDEAGSLNRPSLNPQRSQRLRQSWRAFQGLAQHVRSAACLSCREGHVHFRLEANGEGNNRLRRAERRSGFLDSFLKTLGVTADQSGE